MGKATTPGTGDSSTAGNDKRTTQQTASGNSCPWPHCPPTACRRALVWNAGAGRWRPVIKAAQTAEKYVYDGGSSRGIRAEGKSEWVESKADSNAEFRFAETGRNKDWIRLFDSNRAMVLRLTPCSREMFRSIRHCWGKFPSLDPGSSSLRRRRGQGLMTANSRIYAILLVRLNSLSVTRRSPGTSFPFFPIDWPWFPVFLRGTSGA